MQLNLEISFVSDDCTFLRDKTSKRLIKACTNPEARHIYRNAFQKELNCLQNLNKKASCIPAYYEASIFDSDYSYGSNTTDVIPKGTPFISMEYVQGVTLEQYMKNLNFQGKQPACLLSPRQFSRICQQVYDTICFLYLEKGIAHLDIWPRNIIITNEDTFDIKLIDFTLCYSRDEHKSHQPQNQYIFKKNDHRLHVTIDRPLSATLRRAMMFFVIRLFYASDTDYKSFSPKGLHQFAHTCNGLFDHFFDDVFESPYNEWMLQDACGHDAKNPKRQLELLTDFHAKFQNRLKKLFE